MDSKVHGMLQNLVANVKSLQEQGMAALGNVNFLAQQSKLLVEASDAVDLKASKGKVDFKKHLIEFCGDSEVEMVLKLKLAIDNLCNCSKILEKIQSCDLPKNEGSSSVFISDTTDESETLKTRETTQQKLNLSLNLSFKKETNLSSSRSNVGLKESSSILDSSNLDTSALCLNSNYGSRHSESTRESESKFGENLDMSFGTNVESENAQQSTIDHPIDDECHIYHDFTEVDAYEKDDAYGVGGYEVDEEDNDINDCSEEEVSSEGLSETGKPLTLIYLSDSSPQRSISGSKSALTSKGDLLLFGARIGKCDPLPNDGDPLLTSTPSNASMLNQSCCSEASLAQPPRLYPSPISPVGRLDLNLNKNADESIPLEDRLREVFEKLPPLRNTESYDDSRFWVKSRPKRPTPKNDSPQQVPKPRGWNAKKQALRAQGINVDIAECCGKRRRSSSTGGSIGRCRCPKRPKVSKKVLRLETKQDIPEDEYHWRKYGQKLTRPESNPRSYYRCTIKPGCQAKKHIERDAVDPNILIVTYFGDHCHTPRSKTLLCEPRLSLLENHSAA